MIKEYNIFLFDLDNTLLDYDKCEAYALEKTFKNNNLNYNDNVKLTYKKINLELWKQFEKEEVTKKELQSLRFSKLFNEFNINFSATDFNKLYLEQLGNSNFLVEGAFDICNFLYDNSKKLYIVTNGIYLTQKKRIQSSKIKDFFLDIFISENIGFPKPNIKFFDYVMSALGDVNKSEILIIGDSLTSDIKGGINANIDTCWFNPNGLINNSSIIPTYEIKNLDDLKSHIKLY